MYAKTKLVSSPATRAIAGLRGGLAAAIGLCLACVLVVTPALARADVPGYEYQVHLNLKGTESMSDQADSGGASANQSASWTMAPVDTDLWLPKYSGPPGAACNGGCVTSVTTSDANAAEVVLGPVHESGTYTDDQGVVHSYSCDASVTTTRPTQYLHKTNVGPYSPVVSLETELDTALAPTPFISDPYGDQNLYPCPHSAGWTGNPDGGRFQFLGQFENRDGSAPLGRISVGMLIDPTEIGQPTIGGPAQDFNNIAVSQPDCYFHSAPSADGCQFTFKLSGDYNLTLVCSGTIDGSGNGGCGKTSNPSPPPTDPAKNPPSSAPPKNPANGGGSGKPATGGVKASGPQSKGSPILVGLRVKPQAVRPLAVGGSIASTKTSEGSTVTYGDSQPGSTATFDVERAHRGYRQGKTCTAHKPRHTAGGRCTYYTLVGAFTHVDNAATVAFRFTGRVSGHRLAPGAYRLEAWATNTAHQAGPHVYAAFAVKRLKRYRSPPGWESRKYAIGPDAQS